MQSQKNSYNLYRKGLKRKLTKNILQKEVDCKCQYPDCLNTFINERSLDSFEKLRVSCGHRKIRITSGYRCQRHNRNVDGEDNSRHKLGLALDLEPPKAITLDEFAYRAKDFFYYVKVYKEDNFIHCHNEPIWQ